ncbi:MAG: Crp/Fnr family transcriptional regulator [Leadbetterella sp.]
MQHILLENIRKHTEFSDNNFKVLMSYLSSVKIKKKQFLSHSDQVFDNVAFVMSGCLKSYSIGKEGVEHVVQFAPEGNWITDPNSFVASNPAIMNINAVVDSEVLLLTRKNQLTLFEILPGFERYFRIIAENSMVYLRNRVLDNQMLTAYERYDKFCKMYPHLVQMVPQKQIASFLGITPEFLSKIKAENQNIVS